MIQIIQSAAGGTLAAPVAGPAPRHKIVALGVVTGVGAVSSALATPIVGALSDRTAHGRRVRHPERGHPGPRAGAAACHRGRLAAAALLLTFYQTWPASLGAAVLFGTGYGAYIAVDQALITQVLPKARDRAKDLGIINIAIVCPGAIGALIAAPLVSLAGYPALFGATALVAIAASVGVWKITSVR